MYILRRLYQIEMQGTKALTVTRHATGNSEEKCWSRSMFGLGLVACRILSASSVGGVTLPEWLTGSPAKVI
jgi:hypothetical protein